MNESLNDRTIHCTNLQQHLEVPEDGRVCPKNAQQTLANPITVNPDRNMEYEKRYSWVHTLKDI
jgi:hypothetical protein